MCRAWGVVLCALSVRRGGAVVVGGEAGGGGCPGGLGGQAVGAGRVGRGGGWACGREGGRGRQAAVGGASRAGGRGGRVGGAGARVVGGRDAGDRVRQRVCFRGRAVVPLRGAVCAGCVGELARGAVPAARPAAGPRGAAPVAHRPPPTSPHHHPLCPHRAPYVLGPSPRKANTGRGFQGGAGVGCFVGWVFMS